MNAKAAPDATILVADQDDAARERTAKALARAGFAVVQARDGREALALARESKPDLAVLDAGLPHLDGATVARKLRMRRLTRDVFVVLVRGSADEIGADRSTATDSPWSLEVTKPIKMRKLIAEISARLGSGARPESEDKMQALRSRFVDETRDVFEKLRGRLDEPGSSEVPALADQVRSIAHRMAGSAPMFGCGGLGDLGREVESTIDGWEGSSEAPAERELAYLREKLEQAMELLREAAARSAAASTPAATAAAPGPGATPWERSSASERRERRILLLHDDPELSAAITEIATRRGIRVEAFDSTAPALARMAEHSFDCVVAGGADVRADDFAVVGRIRATCPRVPLIALSSQDSTAARVAATRAGVDRFADAGTDPVRLVEACEHAFASRETRGGRLLVVDDDPTVLALIDTVLTDRGYEIMTLNDPSRLFEMLGTFEPDMLLCDVDMPGVNGVELTGSLRASERWRELPIVIMTRYSDMQSRADAFHAGADDFLTKPIVMEELVIRISARLERDAMKRAALERDPATGALNRKTFLAKASAQWTSPEALEGDAALVLVELENIPAFIQSHGLAAGDEALVAVVDRLGDTFRTFAPLIGRISGESIALVVTGIDADEAGERLEAGFSGIERDKRLNPDGRRQSAIVIRATAAACDASESLAELLDRTIVATDHRVRVTITRVPRRSEVRLGHAFVVEDDDVLREMLTYALERAGFACSAFDNGADALQAMLDADTAGSAPVVLLDIDLPRLDGLSVLTQVEHERPGRFQTILMTAHGTERDRLRGLRANAVDYVCKPVSVAVLVEKAMRLARG